MLIKEEVEAVANLVENFSPDYLEDALETLQDLLANTGR